jgi:hypothetical protein
MPSILISNNSTKAMDLAVTHGVDRLLKEKKYTKNWE